MTDKQTDRQTDTSTDNKGRLELSGMREPTNMTSPYLLQEVNLTVTASEIQHAENKCTHLMYNKVWCFKNLNTDSYFPAYKKY